MRRSLVDRLALDDYLAVLRLESNRWETDNGPESLLEPAKTAGSTRDKSTSRSLLFNGFALVELFMGVIRRRKWEAVS
jgi:hypothetical protein